MLQERRLLTKTYQILLIISSLISLIGCGGVSNKTLMSHSDSQNFREGVQTNDITQFEKSSINPTGTNPWDASLRNLIDQILGPIPPENSIRITIGNFREGQSGVRSSISSLIESDLRAILDEVSGIAIGGAGKKKVKQSDEITQKLILEYHLSGLYHVDLRHLRINAVLRVRDSNQVISSGEVVIRKDDLQTDKNVFDPTEETDTHFSRNYVFTVESLLSSKPNVSPFDITVWTDKKVYRIGESVTFFFRSDQNAYLTLLDVGTSGDLRVLLPNPFQKDNFIEAGRTYAIPFKDADFTISADGPTGVERIKAIATTSPLSIINTEPSEGFFIVSKARSISDQIRHRGMKRLDTEAWSESYTEIYIIEKGGSFPPPGRPRTIKPKKPEKPIDITGTAGLNPPQPKDPEKPIDIIGVAGMKPAERALETAPEALIESESD